MKTYLVDFENVKSKGLSGIDRLTDEDHVIIFYSENSDTISFEMHCMVLQAKAEVDYIKVRVGGKNALDFQLSTLLGYLVAKGDNTHIFVISNDKGFDKLHDFWENTFDDSPACKVFRTSNISAAVNYARYNSVPVEEPEEEEPALPEFEDASGEGGYSEESKVVEFDLSDGAAEITEEEIELPVSAGSIITEAAADVTASYTEEQPVVKPIKQNGTQKNYMPSIPKVIAPGVRHPMLAADEAQAELYEPLFEQFLKTPEAKDKHALLARFMPGADKKAVELMEKLLLKSTSKSELHNLLQQTYDNETSAKLYNMVKRNYYFLKRVLRGSDVTGQENVQTAAQEKAPEAKAAPAAEKPAKQPRPVKTEKPAEAEKAAVQEKPAEAESVPAAEPKKADAELKKRLHEILDSKADADEFSGVIAVINASSTRQQLYINMMQRFKRGRGRELYNIIKDEYVKFTSSEKPAEQESKAKPEKPAKQESKPKAEKPAKQEKKANAEKPVKTEKTAKQEKPAKAEKADKSKKPAAAKASEKKAAKPEKQESKPVKKTALTRADADDKLRELCGEHLVDDLEFVRLRQLISETESAHKLYLAMIKTFGKKRGSAMYNAVKPVHEDISGAMKETESR